MARTLEGKARLLLMAVSLTACQAKNPDREAGTAGATDKTAEATTVDPCALVTVAEIEELTGSKITRTDPTEYGATQVCNHYGATISPVVSVVVAEGMPVMASSSNLVAWRQGQVGAYPDMKFRIEPIEGLGMPAIRNEIEGTGMAGLEIAVRGRLLDITTDNFDLSKALAAKAIPRMP